MMSLSSFAQITVSKAKTGAPKQEAVIAMSWTWIYSHDGAYFLVMKTSNQFDNWMWLKMGATKDECVESAKALLELINTISDTDVFNIESGRGETFRVREYKELGVPGLSFNASGYAGLGRIMKPHITKTIKWFEALK